MASIPTRPAPRSSTHSCPNPAGYSPLRYPLLLVGVVPSHEFIAVGLVVAAIDGLADVINQADHKLQVVDGAQATRQEFLGFEQVVDICAGVIFRDIPTKFFIDTGEIALELRAHQIHTPIKCVYATATSQTSWRDAVKGISTGFNRGEHVIRFRNTE